MYCTSCGSNLGNWPNKSCPRCGAPLQKTRSSADGPGISNFSNLSLPDSGKPDLTPENPPQSKLGTLLLAGLAIFALAVAGLWWWLGMSNPPFAEPSAPAPTNVPSSPEPKPEPKPELKPEPKPEPKPKPPEEKSGLLNSANNLSNTSNKQTETQHTPSPPPAPPHPPRPKPFPASKLAALRQELEQCDNFSCRKKVQNMYCKGYWNKFEECRDALH